MTSELFKEHHPHTISDYLARSMVGFSRSLVGSIGRNSFALRAIIANTILSSFSMVLANRLHHRAILRGLPEREAIEDLLCEASGTHFHIIVIRKFYVPTRFIRILLTIIQSISICFFRFVSCISFKTAHRTLGYMYEKSIFDYSTWIDSINDGNITNSAADLVAIKYWSLKDNASLTDTLAAIRDDNVKYRDYEHGYAEIHNIKKNA